MANATATTIRLSEIGIPAKIRAKAAGNIHAATGMLSMCVIRGLFRRSAEDPAQDLEPQGRQADRHPQLERPDHRLPGADLPDPAGAPDLEAIGRAPCRGRRGK